MYTQSYTRPISSFSFKDSVRANNTLEVRLLNSLNIAIVKGWAIDHNTTQYERILSFIDQQLEFQQYFSVYFSYEVFNCRAASYIMKIIKKLNGYHHAGRQITMHWNCGKTNTEEVMDAGLDFKEFADFNFKISSSDPK